jgi:glutathione S-transferase
MKLVYFNGRGLAEISRILLAIGEEEYEDFRYPLKIIDWSKHQMEKEEFEKDKADGKLVSSLNKVPYLEVDGHVIPQSKSIERYLARKYGLMGENAIEGVRIDSLCECIRDFKDAYQQVRKADDKEHAVNEWFTKTLVEKLSLLENLVDGVGYSVGGKLSLSDVVIFSFITQFFDNKEASMNATLATPKIRSIVEKVMAVPQVISWLEKRPVTGF